MGSNKRGRGTVYSEPELHASGRSRLEEKRQRFAEERGAKPRGLKPATLITIGAIVVVVVAIFMFVGLPGGLGGGAGVASASVIQQAETKAATVENGKVSIPVDEVKAKKIVYWDYVANGKKIPLMAYVTPSGTIKIAIRMCEPCNGFSFRIEGNQIVCNVCGTRWDLETSRGVSGGCQGYPPDVLPTTVVDGKASVDEAKVAGWKVRS